MSCFAATKREREAAAIHEAAAIDEADPPPHVNRGSLVNCGSRTSKQRATK